MSEQEKRIWEAAYAVAFCQQFEASRLLGGYDKAVAFASAERPGSVANEAVRRFREWKRDEEPTLGDEVKP